MIERIKRADNSADRPIQIERIKRLAEKQNFSAPLCGGLREHFGACIHADHILADGAQLDRQTACPARQIQQQVLFGRVGIPADQRVKIARPRPIIDLVSDQTVIIGRESLICH